MLRTSIHLFSKRTLLGLALAATLPVAAFAQAGGTASSSAGAANQHAMMGSASKGASKGAHPASMKAKPTGSPRIKSIQAALNRKEHAHLAVDGMMGAQTRAALTRFQKAHGIKPTGRPTKATEKALGM